MGYAPPLLPDIEHVTSQHPNDAPKPNSDLRVVFIPTIFHDARLMPGHLIPHKSGVHRVACVCHLD